MNQVAAELFDGTSTALQKVVLQLSNDGLDIINDAGNVHHVLYTLIQKLEETSTGFRFTVNNATGKPDSVKQLTFNDKTFYHELLVRSSATHHLLKRWSGMFWRLPLVQVSIGVVLLIAVCIYAFMILLLNAYKVTPDTYDMHLGKRVEATFMRMYDTCAAPELDTFLHKAIIRLTLPDDRFTHRIVVLNDPTENALSIPGGTMYLYRGLLEKSRSPDEVLGVLAHEIAHAEERHSVRQIIQSMGIYYMSSLVIGMAIDGFDLLEGLESALETSSLFLMLRYSRAFEREADSLAIIRLHHANLKVGPLDSLLTRIAPQSGMRDKLLALISTHPLQKERSERFTAARELETFANDTLFAGERADWDIIKKGCPDAGKKRSLLKKILIKTRI